VIDVKVHGDKELIIRLGKMDEQTLKAVEGVVTRGSRLLMGHIMQHHLTGGTTGTRLAVRTGQMRRETREKPTRRQGTIITGGIEFGSKYAGVHVGPRGQKTTIRPKRAQFLTIPLPAAKTAAGAGSGRARDFPDTFIIKSKRGNTLIVRRAGGKGIIPLFVLKKQVTIPARVHPEDIRKAIAPKIKKDLEDSLEKAL
jgi:hypothetical protein